VNEWWSQLKKTCLQHCVYLASDGGRVCRPLVIADKGVSRIKEHHMKELMVMCIIFFHPGNKKSILWKFNFILFQDGVRTFDDFLRDGLLEYLDVNEENNTLVCSTLITFSFSFLSAMKFYLINHSWYP